MADSRFQDDLRFERRLQPVLDGIYSSNGIRFKRMNDTDSQLGGVDAVMTKEGKEFLIDEKAQAHYLCFNLPTFSFEVLYFKFGEFRKGWLFDEHKRTDTYVLVTDIFTEDCSADSQVRSCTVSMVSRRRLLKLLEEKCLNYDSLLNSYSEMMGQGEKRRRIDGWKGCSMHISDQLAEKPFNLVLNLKFLESHGVLRRLFSGKVG